MSLYGQFSSFDNVLQVHSHLFDCGFNRNTKYCCSIQPTIFKDLVTKKKQTFGIQFTTGQVQLPKSRKLYAQIILDNLSNAARKVMRNIIEHTVTNIIYCISKKQLNPMNQIRFYNNIPQPKPALHLQRIPKVLQNRGCKQVQSLNQQPVHKSSIQQ